MKSQPRSLSLFVIPLLRKKKKSVIQSPYVNNQFSLSHDGEGLLDTFRPYVPLGRACFNLSAACCPCRARVREGNRVTPRASEVLLAAGCLHTEGIPLRLDLPALVLMYRAHTARPSLGHFIVKLLNSIQGQSRIMPLIPRVVAKCPAVDQGA